MDHVPQHDQLDYISKFKVPYLCDDRHIAKPKTSFHDFPLTIGFDKHQILFGDYSHHSSSDVASFLQSWLFFGLLEEFLGFRVDRDRFIVQTTDSGPLVSTREALPAYLLQWAKKKPVARTHLDRIEACLIEAKAFVPVLMDPNSPLPPEVALSIQLLGATLEIVGEQKFPRWPPRRFSQPAKTSWGVPKVVENWLSQAGWCRNDIGRVSETLSLPTLIFAASIVRREEVAFDTHGPCSVDACVARDFRGKPYRTRHVHDESYDCGGFIGWSEEQMDRMRRILDDKGVPVLIIDVDEESGPSPPSVKIDAVDSTKTRYIAFSHVWADGLGNQDDNALPVCQLLRLQKLANKVMDPESESKSLLSKFRTKRPMAIWIDTLCVPRTKPHKSIAISRMNQTYAQAEKVLILDSEIYTQPYNDDPQVHLLRLLASGWARRVWTMQEGALGSSNLHIQTSSQTIDVTATARSMSKAWAKQKVVMDAIDIDCASMWKMFSDLRAAHSNDYWRDRVPAMAVSLNLLNGRACTNEGDAYLCLSGMIGLSPEVTREIADLPVADRSMTLLRKLEYLPKGIIFSPGPKLRATGYRWACESFWKSQAYNDDEVAVFKEGLGLHLEYQGFVLKPFHLATDANYFVLEYRTAKLFFKVQFDSSSAPIRDILADLGYDPQTSRLGILCPERDMIRKRPGLILNPGALVLVDSEPWNLMEKLSKPPIKSRYICHVTLTAPSDVEVQLAQQNACLADADRPNIQITMFGADEGVAYMPLNWVVG